MGVVLITNTRMSAVKCLLFAATLLVAANAQSSRDAKKLFATVITSTTTSTSSTTLSTMTTCYTAATTATSCRKKRSAIIEEDLAMSPSEIKLSPSKSNREITPDSGLQAPTGRDARFFILISSSTTTTTSTTTSTSTSFTCKLTLNFLNINIIHV